MAATAVSDRPSAGGFSLDEFAPSPVVNWTELVAVDTPTEAPTHYRLKALRKRNEATPGVRVTLRGEQRAQGTASFHSVLAVWSTRLRQLGHVVQADELRDAGSRIEHTYDRYLRAYLSQHTLDELPRADFFPRLVKDTASALGDVVLLSDDSSDDSVVFVGEVKGRRGATSLIEGQDVTGAVQRADVLTRVLAQRNLTEGALVLVIERMVGNAAVTEVELAVRVPTDAELLEGPPFGDDEYAELAARYRKSGGRTPDASERAADRAALEDDALPRRNITLGE